MACLTRLPAALGVDPGRRNQVPRATARQPARRVTLAPACAASAIPVFDAKSSAAALVDPPADLSASGAARARATTAHKTRVVVLGSGWGAVSFIKHADHAAFGPDGPYELVLVSPRNHMVYTPLLPSAVGGVVSENSITESIRNILGDKGAYYEAQATDIDPAARTLSCLPAQAARADGSQDSGDLQPFTLPYDILLCSVGAVTATFNIPGVSEHCWFLKSMEDAQKLRRHISMSLELAALPNATPEERRRLLALVVVGGGPTGVELAAELQDLVSEDIARTMPGIKDSVSITLVDGQDALLGSYHTEIRTYAGEKFQKDGINLCLGARVKRVTGSAVEVEMKDGSRGSVPYGTCMWATGIAMHPLVAGLKAKLPPELQNSPRGLVVDEHLRVAGTRGTIFCFGDAAVAQTSPQAALPPTAQVARQEGAYLAALLSRNALAPVAEPAPDADVVPLPADTKPFGYLHLGSLAYLGSHKGAMDLPVKTPFLKTLRGYIGGAAWRSLETLMQVSLRTRYLVAMDWLRAAMFGRNLSDI